MVCLFAYLLIFRLKQEFGKHKKAGSCLAVVDSIHECDGHHTGLQVGCAGGARHKGLAKEWVGLHSHKQSPSTGCICPEEGACACVLNHPGTSDSLQPYGLYSSRLLCPWNSPGKNTGVGSHSLLQETFPTQGLSLGLLHCRPPWWLSW